MTDPTFGWRQSPIDAAAAGASSTWHRAITPFETASRPDAKPMDHLQALAAVPGLVTLPFDLIDALAAALPSIPMPAMALFGGIHIGTPHAGHLPSPAPLMGVGPPFLVGAIAVQIGGMPALRTGDVGIAPSCGSISPFFKVRTGSSSVYVGGKRAVRLLDFTTACTPQMPAAASTSATAASLAHGLHRMGQVLAGASIASTLFHAVTGVSSAASVDVRDEGDRIERNGMIQSAAAGLMQGVADIGLGFLAARVGEQPGAPTGAGVLMGLASSAVQIGGSPCPEATELLDVAQAWLRRRSPRPPSPPVVNDPCGQPGEPVRVVDGSVFSDHLDVDLEGLRFGRHYDTRGVARIGDCGRGTRHGYERELDVWLHRVSYVGPDGYRVDFPQFRGEDQVALHGYVARRLPNRRYEITHRGETMLFVAQDDARGARLLEIRDGEHVTSIEHDGAGRFRAARRGARALIAVRDADGLLTRIDDERGIERAAFSYVDGCLTASRNAAGAEERFTYDAAHRLVAWRDARGYRFTWRYDAEGRCVHTSGEDRQWSCDFVYEKNKTTVTHGTGLVETLHHDAYGAVLRITRSDGTSLLREVDPKTGRVLRERDGAGRIVEWLYDEAGENVGRRDRFGAWLPPERDLPREGYDPRARALPATLAPQLGLDTQAERARDASVPEAIAPLAAWALAQPPASSPRLEKDAMGRVVRAVDARGRSVNGRYDAAGNLVETIDRDGSFERADITGWNLVARVTDGLGRRTEVTHTTSEEVRTYRDALGSLTEHGRDAADRMVSVSRDGVLVERFAYDAGGRLVEKADAAGRTLLRITHGKNALPARIAMAEGGAIELEYDAHGRVARARLGEHDARLERDERGVVLFDRRGDRGLRRWRLGAREVTSLLERFDTTIDRRGDVVVVRDPSGRLTSFDAVGGGRVVRSVGNGTREALAFDTEGRLEGRVAHRTTSDGAIASWAVRYERSGEGDLLEAWDTARGRRRFEIDAAHRLAAEVDADGAVYAYVLDAGDNVVAQPGLARAELTPGSVLLRTDRETFTHDARGRMTSRTDASGRTVRYAYDSLDQLVEVDLDDGGPRWRGSYDGLGRLCRFGREGRETELFWDGDRVAAELSPSGAWRVHVYASASALVPFALVDYASVDAAPESGRAYYVFHDASGMPTQIEDASGRTVWWVDRVAPFGALTVHEGAELDYALRWPGHVHDADLGLHHNRFRAYDPALARYLQPDPIGHAGSPQSLYAYAPNPLVDVDLLGLHAATPRPLHETEEAGEGHPTAPRPRRLGLRDLGPTEWAARIRAQVEIRLAAGLVNGRWVQLPALANPLWDPVTRVRRFDPELGARHAEAHALAPEGVHYSEIGEPELDAWAARDADGRPAIVDIEGFGGDRDANMGRADDVVRGRDASWQPRDGHTWHEHANMRTMSHVPTVLHELCPHTGGVARARSLAEHGSVAGPDLTRNGDHRPPILPKRGRAILSALLDPAPEE